VHINNAPAHNSRKTQKRFGHSPLKDVCPWGFYLSGKNQSTLTGREIRDEIDFFEAVTEIVNSISDGELQRVFRS
jgi:hypothetical protein